MGGYPRPAKHVAHDANVRLPTSFDFGKPQRGKPAHTPDQDDLPDHAEVYVYSGAYAFLAQQRGDDPARIRMEEWESRAKRYHGAGAWLPADAGMRFISSAPRNMIAMMSITVSSRW